MSGKRPSGSVLLGFCVICTKQAWSAEGVDIERQNGRNVLVHKACKKGSSS